MADLQGHTLATTGATGLHAEQSAFGITAAGWVALSMLVVVALLIWRKVPGLIARALDARIATIRGELDESSRLRAAAEAMLAEARARTASSEADAVAIVARAEQEAQHIRAQADADAAELVERRGKMAEDKIAAAERQALGEVRAKAAEAATRAAAALIAGHHDAGADKALVDRSIAGLARLN